MIYYSAKNWTLLPRNMRTDLKLFISSAILARTGARNQQRQNERATSILRQLHPYLDLIFASLLVCAVLAVLQKAWLRFCPKLDTRERKLFTSFSLNNHRHVSHHYTAREIFVTHAYWLAIVPKMMMRHYVFYMWHIYSCAVLRLNFRDYPALCVFHHFVVLKNTEMHQYQLKTTAQ